MKELTITPPEGYEIDKENSTFEKIVFKPIDTKPKSWKEFCDNYRGIIYYIQDEKTSQIGVFESTYGLNSVFNNFVPSREYAEAFLALMQLISLRQAWVGDWKPDWNSSAAKFLIVYRYDRLYIDLLAHISHPLSFPTNEMAQEFLKCFKDLIEKAKYLL